MTKLPQQPVWRSNSRDCVNEVHGQPLGGWAADHPVAQLTPSSGIRRPALLQPSPSLTDQAAKLSNEITRRGSLRSPWVSWRP
jgi:hypothetical protein